MKPSSSQLAAALKQLDPAVRLVLLFGPDEALVRERATQFSRQVAADLSDGFAVVDLTGSDIAGNPSRLADEACAIGLLADRKLVRASNVRDDCTEAFTDVLDRDGAENLIVATAGELTAASRLRKLAETHARALAVACYAEEGAQLRSLMMEAAGALNISLDRDAQTLVLQAVGPARDVLRSELVKLALYTGGGTVTGADVEAVGADMGAAGVDRLVNAVASGVPEAALRQLDHLTEEGQAGIMLLRAVGRRILQLIDVRTAMARGSAPEQAIRQLRPPLFWKDQQAFSAQIGRWPLARLTGAAHDLLEAERLIKSSGSAGDILARRCLMSLAARAAAAQPGARPGS